MKHKVKETQPVKDKGKETQLMMDQRMETHQETEQQEQWSNISQYITMQMLEKVWYIIRCIFSRYNFFVSLQNMVVREMKAWRQELMNICLPLIW